MIAEAEAVPQRLRLGQSARRKARAMAIDGDRADVQHARDLGATARFHDMTRRLYDFRLELLPGAEIAHARRAMVHGLGAREATSEPFDIVDIANGQIDVEVFEIGHVAGSAHQRSHAFVPTDELFRDVAAEKASRAGDDVNLWRH
jgi:hypothetical protein